MHTVPLAAPSFPLTQRRNRKSGFARANVPAQPTASVSVAVSKFSLVMARPSIVTASSSVRQFCVTFAKRR